MSRAVHIDGSRKKMMDGVRARVMTGISLFGFVFVVIAIRLIDLGLISEAAATRGPADAATSAFQARADIVDRNGVLLATDLEVASAFANPSHVRDKKAAAEKLAAVLKGVDTETLYQRLSRPGQFVWIKRKLTPNEVWAINRLGIPGVQFLRERARVYPQANTAAHVLGFTDVDNKGIAGIEAFFDTRLRNGGKPLMLSLDIRAQHALQAELARGMKTGQATAAAGVILDVQTGEVVAMASLPDYDPNNPPTSTDDRVFNRATKAVFEMGSTFKTFTVAAALDSGAADLTSRFDARQPIRYGRFEINDFHGKHRVLSVPEIFMYSSNIGSARLALATGTDNMQQFLDGLGLLSRPAIELPEVAAPLVPGRWRDINTMTISFGHGVAVSALQLASATAAIVDDGVIRPATLIRLRSSEVRAGRQVVSADTSRIMRALLRLVVTEGTGSNADADGYRVGGKTGTAEKNIAGSYRPDRLVSSFVAAFPIDDPRFVIVVLLDDPKGNGQRDRATGGWVAAPIVKRLTERLAPLMGVLPNLRMAEPMADELRSIMAASAEVLP